MLSIKKMVLQSPARKRKEGMKMTDEFPIAYDHDKESSREAADHAAKQPTASLKTAAPKQVLTIDLKGRSTHSVRNQLNAARKWPSSPHFVNRASLKMPAKLV